MNINLTYEDMTRAVEGPENVLGHLRGGPSGAGLGRSYNTITGHVEQQAMSDIDFRNQEMSFNVLGYARNASILGNDAALQPFVGDIKAAAIMNGQSLRDYRPGKVDVKATKRRRKNKGKLGVFDDPDKEKIEGEDSEDEENKAYMGPWAGWKDDVTAPLIPEEEEYALPERRAKKGPIIEKSKKEVGFGEEKSVFHGKLDLNYRVIESVKVLMKDVYV